jgi:hypothetical protein
MALFGDFEEPTTPAPRDARSSGEPLPMVVIQYRSRPWRPTVLLPVLVLTGTAVIVGSQLAGPWWLAPAAPVVHRRPPASDAGPAGAITPMVHIRPVVIAEPPPPEPPLPPPPPGLLRLPPALAAAAEAPITELSPTPDRAPLGPGAQADDPADAPGPAVPEPVAETAAIAPPEPPRDPVAETRQAFAAIREEAERKRQELGALQMLREDFPLIEQQDEEARRQEREQQRGRFRAELQALLQGPDREAGRAIWDLALSAGVEPPADVQQAIARELNRKGPKLDRRGRIAVFRARGMTESEILARLVREQLRMIPSRKGPRDANDAIVRAARQLLASPVPRTIGPASTTTRGSPSAQLR